MLNNKSVKLDDWNPLITNCKEGIVLYGAGIQAAKFIIELKHKFPDANILCIADADVGKQGGSLFDIPVVAPEGLKKYGPQTLIVITPVKYCIAITTMLNEMGFLNIIHFHSWNALVCDGIAGINASITRNREKLDRLLHENDTKISSVRNWLRHDEKSVSVFDAKLDSMYFGKHINLEALHEGNQYFPSDIMELSAHEVFVDCGAYNGETVLDFIHKAKQYNYIYSFEPDPWQYVLTKMSLDFARVEHCEVYNSGVYDCEGELKFSRHTTGASRINQEGDIIVPVVKLDTLLYGKPERPTFIKMDVEGAELNALEGCRKIIERDHPKLAISVYHDNIHLYEIPYWIKSNFPDYSIYLRQHSNFTETVCYAVIE